MKRWNRLLSLIPPETKVIADIGTDHGYLAIQAIKNNKAQVVYATDIASAPLKQAKKNINLVGLSGNGQIKLIQSNGLEFLAKLPNEIIDYVVIAGLGTSTIHEIVKLPRSQVKNYLILSNTEVSKLRYWAQLNNFQIQFEDFFYHKSHPYWLILINSTHTFQPVKNFNFGDWERWYQNNMDYQNYLLQLKNRHQSYNKKITNPSALSKNKQYIREIENYLKQWN